MELRVILASAFSFGASIAMGYFLRDSPSLMIFPFIVGCGFCVALLVHLGLGLVPRWRRYYGLMAVSCGFVVLCFASYTGAGFYFWSSDEQIAKNYVATIWPRLEDYRLLHHGRYPDLLSDIAGLPQAPEGLTYENRGDKTYYFHYFEIYYYSGSAQWMDDD
jgi:hypothetical protein